MRLNLRWSSLTAITSVVIALAATAAAEGEPNIGTLHTQAAAAISKGKEIYRGTVGPTKSTLVNFRPSARRGSPCDSDVVDKAGEQTTNSLLLWEDLSGVEKPDGAEGRQTIVLRNESLPVTIVFSEAKDATAAYAAASAFHARCRKARQAMEFLKTTSANNFTKFGVQRADDGGVHGNPVKITEAEATSSCVLSLTQTVSGKVEKRAQIKFQDTVEARPWDPDDVSGTALRIAGPFLIKDDGKMQQGRSAIIDPGAREMMWRMVKAVEYLRAHCNPTASGDF